MQNRKRKSANGEHNKTRLRVKITQKRESVRRGFYTRHENEPKRKPRGKRWRGEDKEGVRNKEGNRT